MDSATESSTAGRIASRRRPKGGRPGGHPWLLIVLLVLCSLHLPAGAQQPEESPLPRRSGGPTGFNLSASLGWNYLTKPDVVSPDYQNLRLRLTATAPSLWKGRGGLRVVLYEKTGIQERGGGMAGTRFRSRHEIRTLALDLGPRSRLGATLGRHRPTSSALGVNDVDGATLRWGRPGRGFQAALFGGFSVEYWESEFETRRPMVGALLRVGARARGPSAEISGIRERFEGGHVRTRVGASGGWSAGELTLDGRTEVDLSAGLLSYARLSATGKIGSRLAPYIQAGHRRGPLFTESPGVVEGLAENAGYRGPLRDVGVGSTWRVSRDLTLDGGIRLESGVRNSFQGDLDLRAEKLPYGFTGRIGSGGARSVWARSAHGTLGLEHGIGTGRLALDASAVGYRWRRPGLSSSTRFRITPGMRLLWPLPWGANLSLTGREIVDDRGTLRSEMSAWINYRLAP